MVAQIATASAQMAQFLAENVRFSGNDMILLGSNMIACAFVYYFLRFLKLPDHSWYLTLFSSFVILRRVVLVLPRLPRRVHGDD